MRTHEFEFKKTVKRTQKFKAISIDLTVAEAEVLYGFCVSGRPLRVTPGTPTRPTWPLWDLLDALESFLAKNGVYVDDGA